MFNTTTDYTDRTMDLEILQTTERPTGGQSLSKTIRRNDRSRYVTGLQKLVQRYVLLFLSQKDSIPWDTDQGTDFVDAVNKGLIQNRSQIVAYFAFANSEVNSQLSVDDDEGLPDDERFDSAELLDYYLDFGTSTLYLKIKITSLAGDDYTFTIPT